MRAQSEVGREKRYEKEIKMGELKGFVIDLTAGIRDREE